MTARRIPTNAKSEHVDVIVRAPAASRRLHPLFVISIGLRIVLSALMMLGAVYVLRLVGMSDFAGWLVLGLTTAGVACVLLDESLDIEGRIAEQAARVAVFEPDRYGARNEAVRTYADCHVRTRGRIPRAHVRLWRPDTHQPFSVYFPCRRAQVRRWCLYASLLAIRRVAQFVAVGLAVVLSAQIYFLARF
jgi:hypothetical protein